VNDQAGAGDKLHLLRTQRWSGFIKALESGDDWVSTGLLPVARLAREHPQLGPLFPFQSLNRLCFSRCFPGPYTNDCPCIAVDNLGRFGVSAYPYPRGEDWDVTPPPPHVGDARDAAHAIELAAANLPPNADEVWLSTVPWSLTVSQWRVSPDGKSMAVYPASLLVAVRDKGGLRWRFAPIEGEVFEANGPERAEIEGWASHGTTVSTERATRALRATQIVSGVILGVRARNDRPTITIEAIDTTWYRITGPPDLVEALVTAAERPDA
jgi:hypothetical protein